MRVKSPIVLLAVSMLLVVSPTTPAALGAHVKHAARGNIQGTVSGAAGGVTVSLYRAKKHHHGTKLAKTAVTTTTTHVKHHRPPLMTTVTKADGSFSFTGLPAGEYKVKAHSKHQGKGKAKAAVKNNATASVTLTLTKNHKKKAA